MLTLSTSLCQTSFSAVTRLGHAVYFNSILQFKDGKIMLLGLALQLKPVAQKL